nr:MAG TPA: hypothetical protein [Caudoviricetes sp.]
MITALIHSVVHLIAPILTLCEQNLHQVHLKCY